MNKCSYINKKYLRLKQDMEIAEMNKIVRKIDRSQFEEAAYILKALAHETRLCVIMQLTQTEELSVSELREKWTVSNHCFHIILQICVQKVF